MSTVRFTEEFKLEAVKQVTEYKRPVADLARFNRCQISEVLSDLINKEYRRLESEIRAQFD